MLTSWEDRCVLITGACGFVGANLSRVLIDHGATVIGCDRAGSSPSLRALFGGVIHPFVVLGDVTDLNDMLSLVDQVRPDVIYHLAGQGHIKDAQEEPWPAFHVNVMGTVAVLEAVRRIKPDTVVVCASSNHAYVGGPQPAFGPFLCKSLRDDESGTSGYPEANPLNGNDVYGASKAMGDRAVACYRHSLGLRTAAVRHVNAYGPGDPHATHLVIQSILACLSGAVPTLRGYGSAVKGYLHIADVVSAYLMIADRVDEVPGHAVNVTDPMSEASVLTIMRIVCAVAGLDPDRVYPAPESSSDQEGYEERLDASLMESFGWRPRFNLHTGIADTVAWYRTHRGMAWLV